MANVRAVGLRDDDVVLMVSWVGGRGEIMESLVRWIWAQGVVC